MDGACTRGNAVGLAGDPDGERNGEDVLLVKREAGTCVPAWVAGPLAARRDGE